MTAPAVSILLPVLNEANHILDTLSDLLAQEYSGRLEVIVADGGSSDGTRDRVAEIAAADSRVRLIDNPQRRQAFGLNAAAEAATGQILIRADGHSRYATDYVARSVAGVEKYGGAVGGRMNPVGFDRFSAGVASAMNSPLTMGPARFHHATEVEQVDTVYLGAFTAEDFKAVGGVRSFPSGSSEDADFYFRWRRSGRVVHVDPAIRSSYTPRNTVSRLWRQYWNYGRGKAEMLWVNRRFPSFRPLAPLFLVLGFGFGFALGMVSGVWWPLLALVVAWLLILVVAAWSGRGSRLATIGAGAIMHLAYGLGLVWGLLRGPGPLRHLR